MTLLYIYSFYLGFALSIGVYRQWVAGKLKLLNKIIFAPVLLVFILLDVVLNYTILIVLFGLPGKHDYTISSRLETYRAGEPGFKKTIANFICSMLSEIDTSGRHC